MSNYIKITAKVKSAEELTGYPGIVTFRGYYSNGMPFYYSPKLNRLASLPFVKIKPYEKDGYHYLILESGGILARSDWLKDISYIVDWSKCPIDEIIEVSNDQTNWYKMCFAGYDENDPNNKPFYTFAGGRNSKTSLPLREVVSVTLQDWNVVAGKYFLLYSKNNSYYVWFNLDNRNTDPGLQNKIPIEVNIQTGSPASYIANLVKEKLNTISDFNASISQNNNRVVEITIQDVGKVYDASPGNSGLSISIRTQGGDVVSWSFARPILP